MKKFIFGCMLMLCGAICGTGWLIAEASLIQRGAWSTMMNLLPGIGYGKPSGYVILLFYIIAIIGAAMAAQNLNDK